MYILDAPGGTSYVTPAVFASINNDVVKPLALGRNVLVIIINMGMKDQITRNQRSTYEYVIYSISILHMHYIIYMMWSRGVL